jgi:hypothetical protein
MTRRVLISMAAIVVLLVGSSPARAVEPIPCNFYGIVRIDGGHVRMQSKVTALINGVPYPFEFSVLLWNGDYWYQADIRGYDPDSPETESFARPGDIISFRVDGLPAVETGTWSTGPKPQLNLNVHPRHLFLPLVRHKPDPAAAGIAP